MVEGMLWEKLNKSYQGKIFQMGLTNFSYTQTIKITNLDINYNGHDEQDSFFIAF